MSTMPTTLIGVQDWYIACLRRNGFRGAGLIGSRARRALRDIGFTWDQSNRACRDAFDIWELERICNDAR